MRLHKALPPVRTRRCILKTLKETPRWTKMALLSSVIRGILMESSRLTPEDIPSSKGRENHLLLGDQLLKEGPIRLDLVQIVTVRKLFILKILLAELSLIAKTNLNQSMSVIQRLTKLRRTTRTGL